MEIARNNLKSKILPISGYNVGAPVLLYFLLKPKANHLRLDGACGKLKGNVYVGFKWDKARYMIVRDKTAVIGSKLYYCAIALDDNIWENIDYNVTQKLYNEISVFLDIIKS